MAVSIPAYILSKVCWFLEHATGIHPSDTGSNAHTSPANGQSFSSPYHPAVCCLWALQWHFICVSISVLRQNVWSAL